MEKGRKFGNFMGFLTFLENNPVFSEIYVKVKIFFEKLIFQIFLKIRRFFCEKRQFSSKNIINCIKTYKLYVYLYSKVIN